METFSFCRHHGPVAGAKSGLLIALISGENSPLVDRLASKLGIADVHKDCKDKAGALRKFSERHGLPLQEICFIGDDVNDLAVRSGSLASAPVPRMRGLRFGSIAR